ncbi:thiol reductant ABC exporter subunit CydC [Nocardia sp. NPDC020380]|uniref:thiol reductant ABC exporter subunit CydC n=1 Tax=Nocardia sp. NPDC020380 TaxID=3364309 RepID=UPI00378E5B14
MSISVPQLLRLLLPYRKRVLLAALAAASAELSSVALMATAAWLIARAADHPPISAVALAIVAVRALALGRGGFRYAERILGHDSALAAVTGLRADVYRALEPLAPEGVSAFRDGDLLTRVVDDVDAVLDLLLRCLMPAVVAAGVAFAATTFTATLAPAAAGVLVAGLLLAGVAVPWLVFVSASRTRAEKDVRGALAARTVDLIQGAADLAAYNATGAATAAANRLGTELARLERRRARHAGLSTAAVTAIQGGTTLIVAMLALHTRQSALTTIVLVVLTLTTFEAVALLPEAARRFAEVRTSARRLSAVLDAPRPVAEPVNSAVPQGHTVDIRGLRVPGRLDNPLTLRLAPGRRVALVGPSGSGKSTVFAALMRFVAYEGSITVGGAELSTLHGDSARRIMTGMTQDAHVFTATLRENLLFAAPTADFEELRTAARRARLLEWIESLPEGWDTVVGDGGTGMSGGQRRRLLLARALLADPPVLLLDEPTEGLDPDTAAALLADLLDATRERTTLIITHSAAATAIADEIYSTAP